MMDSERTLMRDMAELLECVLLEHMGGTPDLFCPRTYEMFDDPWDEFDRDVKGVLERAAKAVG